MRPTPNTNRWLAAYRPNPRATLRLFCFPYAGGAASIFQTWPQRLPPTVEVCPVQLPGRGARLAEPAFTAVEPLVEAAARELAAYFDKPFAFFGHSMGAVIGFELARLLRAAGRTGPRQLYVSGRRAPQLPDDDPPTYNLPEPEFIEELRRLEGTPREVLEHQELMQLIMPLLRADFQLIQTYRYTPGPPLDCPVTAYGGLRDADANREAVEAWRAQTTAAFKLRMLPGGHFFLHSDQALFLQTLAQDLMEIKP